MTARYRPPSTAYQRQDLTRYVRPDPDRYDRIVADDVPKFDAALNPEIDPNVRLDNDLAFVRLPTRRLFRDYRANPDAYRHLDTMPAEGESLHMVISGKYALWEIVPALIERAGQNIAELYVGTLGFSKSNGSDLCGLLDGGQIGRVTFVVSYYFKSTSAPIYDAVIPELLKRNQRVLSMRNHAKFINAKMQDGTCYCVESSANLRSSVNLEMAVMSRSPELYGFHREWIEGVIAKSSVKGRHGEHEDHAARAARKPKR